MELREYWGIARRWWWMLVLCMLLGGGAAYLVSHTMEPTFEASTSLVIGGSLDVVNPTTGELQSSEKLAYTYAELVKTRPIVEATMQQLQLAEPPRITVTLLRNTQIMRIAVADSHPGRAAATADELARQLIQQSPSAPQREEQSYREVVLKQLDDLDREMTALSEAIAETKDTADTGEIARLQEELNTRRATYSSLLNYIKGSAVNYIRVIEPAEVPDTPTSPKVLQNTILAALVGLMLAGGAAFLIEYLDDSVKGQEDIQEGLGLPVLGNIVRMGERDASPETVGLDQPASVYAESYRMLYTNLRYSIPASTKQRLFLITSVGLGEGKTTTAANLAVIAARAGQKVILVDADLRRPAVHRAFGCSQETGFSSLLVGEADSLEEVLVPCEEVPGLWIAPAGPLPPNAAELLGSPRMRELIEHLGEQADLVVIDSPPLMVAADASILASLVTATILVVRSGRTRLEAVVHAKEMTDRVAGHLLGVVINDLNLKRGKYYYSHDYHYYAYKSSYGEASEKRRGEPQSDRGNGHRPVRVSQDSAQT